MAEDDDEDDEDKELLKLGDDFNGSLTLKQREQLKQPNANFSFEEEFYILYESFLKMASELGVSKDLQAIGARSASQEKLNIALAGIKTARVIGELLMVPKLPPPPDDYLIWIPPHLPQDKLEWGRKVLEAIDKDGVLKQIWGIRLQELVEVVMPPRLEFCAEVERKVIGSPPEHLKLHILKGRNAAEEVPYREAVLEKAFDAFMRDYWCNDQEVPNLDEKLDAMFEDYYREHADELKFAAKRRDDRYEQIQKELKEQGIDVKAEAEKMTNPLGELLARLGMSLGDCGNPDCPIHGNQDQQSETGRRPSREPTLKSLPPAAPAQSETKEEENQMTSMMKAPSKNDKKGDEDEIKFSNMSVQFVDDPNCKHIKLPEGMSLKEGRYWLQKIEEEETRTFIYERKFKGWYPLDAMWAAYKALAELHGFVHVGDFKNWWGDTPPTMMTIDIKYGVTQQIPWGPIEVSGFSSPLIPSIELEQGLPTLVFKARIRNNERGTADKLMKKTEEELKKNSIYRGKAVEVDFTMFHPADFRFDPTKAPRFWDCSTVSTNSLILPDDVQAELNTSLWGPIRKTAQARKHKIPLRRGVLIDGSYGVGKTLAARVTAKLCEDNGWTFLYLKHLDQLEAALYFAKKYEPCVIFAEDVNRIVNGERDAEMDKLFNVMDGVDRKDDEVMVVFTTNNIEEIHAGMLRPGRIDSVIKVTPPDAVAARKLVHLYGRSEDGNTVLENGIDLEEVGSLLAGQIPAIIREAVERAKIAAILDTEEGQEVRVKNNHLLTTSRQMLLHAELLKPPAEETPDLVVLGQAIGAVIANGVRSNYSSVDPDWNKSTKEVLKGGISKVLDESGRPETNGNGHQPEA